MSLLVIFLAITVNILKVYFLWRNNNRKSAVMAKKIANRKNTTKQRRSSKIEVNVKKHQETEKRLCTSPE